MRRRDKITRASQWSSVLLFGYLVVTLFVDLGWQMHLVLWLGVVWVWLHVFNPSRDLADEKGSTSAFIAYLLFLALALLLILISIWTGEQAGP